jgi:hypothetical protein
MGNPPVVRKAVVTNVSDLERVRAYLPQNYRADQTNGQGPIVIHGKDNAGWTLDDYVIPRLASGLIVATEITN